MIIDNIIAIIFLFILSVLDLKSFHLKEGFIPSILTTSFLITMFLFNGINGIYTGIFAFLLGMLLVDLDLFKGIADWKVFIACGISLPSFLTIGIFGAFTCAIAIPYQLLIKKTKFKEIPFIPVLLIAYLGIMAVVFL